MDGARNDHQFLVVRILAVFDHVRISVPREIAGVRLLAVDYEDRAADVITLLQDRLIYEALAADDVPASVGV